METRSTPQAFLSSYAPRLRAYNNSLLTPVVHSNAPSNPLSRTTKRGTTIVNYAEDGYDYDEEDDDDSRRRPTGLRSIRREDSSSRAEPGDRIGKETLKPVQVQGIYRDWMLKARGRSDLHNQAQASMPVTLIPIRIDVDIHPFIPAAPFTLPRGMAQPGPGADPTLYRPGELTVPYKLRDIFLWNLHETVITTDQFAATLVQDLDLPNQPALINEISKQIRTQLEEYAGVALHPLFHSEDRTPPNGAAAAPAPTAQSSFRDTPATPATPLHQSARGPETPLRNGLTGLDTPTKVNRSHLLDVTATATPIPASSDDFNPDDTYRCVVDLNINLASQLYTDKFEWSLLHPPGTAEAFAKVTCADLGLSGEWVPALTHAIYEAVLLLKRGACESGGLVSGWGAMGTENDAAHSADVGWRYDPEHLADKWEPKIEFLSKEEMEKREIAREREVRRMRRETARFSSNAGMIAGTPLGGGFSFGEVEEERMGRGERTKKKRRFRSLSPLGRSGTPGGRGTPDAGYGGGGSGSLTDQERIHWRCTHCRIWGQSVWAVRDGPYGPRSLCANCGRVYEQTKKLPRWTKNMHG